MFVNRKNQLAEVEACELIEKKSTQKKRRNIPLLSDTIDNSVVCFLL